jgi:hypothetical protein
VDSSISFSFLANTKSALLSYTNQHGRLMPVSNAVPN